MSVFIKFLKFLILGDEIGGDIRTQTKIYNRWLKNHKVVYSVSHEIDIKTLQVKYKKPILYQETEFHRLITVYDKPLKPLEYKQTKGLIIGNSLDGVKFLHIDKEFNHVLLTGCSGSGKSCTARVMILNCILNDVEVYIHDNKSSDDYDIFKNHAHLSKGIDEFPKLMATIKSLMKIEHTKPIMIFIDEVFVLKLFKGKMKLYDELALLLSTARSFNIHFVIISQRQTTDILPSTITTHCSNRICLQTSTKQESINMIYEDSCFYITKKGMGYLSVNGKLIQIQSFYLADEEIKKLLPPSTKQQIYNNENVNVKSYVKKFIIGGDLDGDD